MFSLRAARFTEMLPMRKSFTHPCGSEYENRRAWHAFLDNGRYDHLKRIRTGPTLHSRKVLKKLKKWRIAGPAIGTARSVDAQEASSGGRLSGSKRKHCAHSAPTSYSNGSIICCSLQGKESLRSGSNQSNCSAVVRGRGRRRSANFFVA